MKTKFHLLVQPVIIFLLAACGLVEEDWQQTVTGTYAASYEQFYSAGQDTLYIEKKERSKNLYQITRHTAYRRKGNDSVNSVIHKSETCTATAEESRQTLYLFPSGRRFWYDRETETIHAGEFIYKKIQ